MASSWKNPNSIDVMPFPKAGVTSPIWARMVTQFVLHGYTVVGDFVLVTK